VFAKAELLMHRQARATGLLDQIKADAPYLRNVVQQIGWWHGCSASGAVGQGREILRAAILTIGHDVLHVETGKLIMSSV
jgi:hypothetical protein